MILTHSQKIWFLNNLGISFELLNAWQRACISSFIHFYVVTIIFAKFWSQETKFNSLKCKVFFKKKFPKIQVLCCFLYWWLLLKYFDVLCVILTFSVFHIGCTILLIFMFIYLFKYILIKTKLHYFLPFLFFLLLLSRSIPPTLSMFTPHSWIIYSCEIWIAAFKVTILRFFSSIVFKY